MIITPVSLPLYFVCLGIDIVIFFLVIRLILNWRSIRFLDGFDKAGKTLVDGLTERIGRFCCFILKKTLSANGKLFVSITILSLAKYIFCSLIKLLF